MKRRLIRLISILLALISAFSLIGCKNGGGEVDSKSYVLADGGKSEYKILISANASVVEGTASRELQKYLNKIAGVTLPIVTDNVVKVSVYEKYISIGETALKQKAKIDNQDMNIDGYVLKTVGETLFIVGQQGAGTLFGVYGFLDDYLGVKFLTADYEYVPTTQKIEINSIDDREIPDISNRTSFADTTECDKFFNAKLRSKAYRLGDCIELGGKYGDLHKLGVHSLGTFINIAENIGAHPEWWTNPNDTSDRNVPCFSNGVNIETGRLIDEKEDEVETYLEAVIEKFKTLILKTNNPIEYYVLGQPDSQKLCDCNKCKEQLVTVDGNRSAQFMIWANAVAWEIEEWINENYQTDERLTVNGVKKQVNFLRVAYQWSVIAPVKKDASGNYVPINDLCKPRSNMGVYFIPITGCFMHGLFDDNCDTNKNTVGLYFKQWMSICNTFAVFDYCEDYHNYLNWFPNLSSFANNLRIYVEAGVTGYILEGGLGGSGAFYQQNLMSWVGTKLMWDSSLNMMDLVSEFNKYYFGEEAGKIVDEFVVYMQANSEAYSALKKKCVNPYGSFTSKEALNEIYLARCYDYIERIENVYENSNLSDKEKEEYYKHLEKLSIQVDYMKYVNYDSVSFVDEQTKYDFMTAFFDKCERVGVLEFTEKGPSLTKLRKQLGY